MSLAIVGGKETAAIAMPLIVRLGRESFSSSCPLYEQKACAANCQYWHRVFGGLLASAIMITIAGALADLPVWFLATTDHLRRRLFEAFEKRVFERFAFA